MDGELSCGIFDLQRPATADRLPLILASPHSGTDYPAEFVAASRLDPLALRRSEDSFVDELFAAAPSLGAPLLAARFPRAYLDVNREAYELDPAMFSDALPAFVNAGSPRVRMGSARSPASSPAARRSMPASCYFRRGAAAHRRRSIIPITSALRRLVDETAARYSAVIC